MNIVQFMPTLNGMQKKGLIKFAPETGCKIGKRTIYYVDEVCDGVPNIFGFNGHNYCLQYVSGCFYPYVTYHSPIKK